MINAMPEIKGLGHRREYQRNGIKSLRHKGIWGLYGLGLLLCAGIPAQGMADEGLRFHDIAANDGAGISYRRTESLSDAIYDEIKQKGVLQLEEGVFIPANSRGAPGVAVFDYDGDGDQDIYVTNGPGTANSLYANRLKESGRLYFEDVGVAAGVAALEQDSTGVCFGDIDNDGDPDLLVLGNGMGNLLYENQGEGTFKDISMTSGVGGMDKHPSSCSMGDVNGDGLLDITVGNTFNNWEHRLALMTFDHDFLMEHNQLFINKGENVFMDVSADSGIQTIARITWAVALVDYDQDGDADLIIADDQGPRAPAKYGGFDYGYIRIYNNDGSGKFTEMTEHAGTERFGAWMGLSFGDINTDGHLDFFASNIGDYAAVFTAPMFNFGPVIGEWASIWFFGTSEGKFVPGSAGEMVTTPFGWGTSMADYDNDGDTDIVFHGGLDVGVFQDASNPGVILQNDGNGNFRWDAAALAASTDHTRRNVRGVAVADLDDNGFIDIVSVSNQDWLPQFPLIPYFPTPLGGVFDAQAFIWPTFMPLDPTNLAMGFVWSGLEPVDGTLSVEISDGNNDDHWVKVNLLGTVGLLDEGRVNRDGIGAVVRFTPRGGTPVLRPVLGGSSYASQDSLESIFGLGSANKGVLEVLWPGGVRNRLYGVHAQERITFPEIPCSYDDAHLSLQDYTRCVRRALDGLHRQGVLERKQRGRFLSSAIKAYRDAHKRDDDDKSERDGEDK